MIIIRSLIIYLFFIVTVTAFLIISIEFKPVVPTNNVFCIVAAITMGFPLYMVMMVIGSLLGLSLLEKLTTPNLPKEEVNNVLLLWFFLSFVISFLVGPKLLGDYALSIYCIIISILKSFCLISSIKETWFFVALYIFQFLGGFGVGMFLREKMYRQKVCKSQ